ncbi:penicillin-binding protein 1C [Ottowia sp.]|uniref:penicillin-binding protein 1C n=1 Tax=Ottowia sp. TaxID=1898956 RepID=UPI002BD96974|nr:penicillin-binding protein 1C [Ottowia sp.]HOB67441.1 penicillin-binding protein 1C [Ottowia sp.]HPZ56560.1 penicillin-binding protein 1C [Ottowia sp.]HQD46867.1 penicillin-binding protein 1C [Ottowia sp.]
MRQARGGVAALALCAAWAAHATPGFAEVRAHWQPSDTVLLDRAGQPIHRLRSDDRARRGAWVALVDVSPALRQAVLFSEDRRFYEHSGVDWRAVSAAAWANLWNTRTRGASTLTMQLAGLLDDDLRQSASGRSLGQKARQAVLATRLEGSWRKDQILEAYLNLVPFRGELVGIDALSRTLFDKAPHGLQESEAAIAAALLRAPNARAPAVARRACGVLRTLRGDAGADCVALDMQVEAVLGRRAFAASEGVAPHAARRLLAAAPAAGAPATLHSTIDGALQRLALQTLQRQVRELHGRNVADGAVVVLDNASGDVLAWVGSTGPLSAAAEVDGVTAPRQAGSTLKPFLYAQAIAERRLTAASLLDDSPEQLQTASGLYIPQNYDRQFKGHVSVRVALAASLNVPAVRTLVMVSPDAFARQLNALGIALKHGGDHYGYSLALGSAEVSLLQLTNAFRALANGGQLCPVRLQATSLPPSLRQGRGGGRAASDSSDGPPTPALSPEGRESKPPAQAGASTCTPAIDPAAAFIVGDILSDPNARSRTFGTDSVLATRAWTAVKTGTSKDMRDNWAVGYSQRYTVGVWLGNASGAAMWDVSGTSGAAPVWATLMRHLHAHAPSRPPAPPAGVVRRAVRFGDPLEAARDEWFLPGTEQALFAIDSEAAGARPASAAARIEPKSVNQPAVPARITAPADGTILALDPDIPPARQRLTLLADAGGAAPASLRWWIGARAIGHGPRAQWLPWPGRHVVQLRDASGRVHDERRLEVRGAAVKPAAARTPR